MAKKRWTVSEVVAAEYCEKKVVLDRQYGDRPSPHIHQLREQGEADHNQFEKHGKRIMATQDRRCYIATAIYGADAPETNQLRLWRDQKLQTSSYGRILTRLYYWGAPYLVILSRKIPVTIPLLRRCLDHIVRRIGRTEL